MVVPSRFATINVSLLDEGVDIWRPVVAKHILDEVYRIVADASVLSDERWRFLPGELVCCRQQQLSGGEHLVAFARAPE